MFGAQQPPAHAPVKTESPELHQARAKLAQLELLLKQGKTILQELRAQANAVTKERDELRGHLDALRVKFEAAVAQKSGFVAATEEAVAAMEAAIAERDSAMAERDAAVTNLDAAVAEITNLTGKRNEVSLLLSELRADRDRIADEMKSAESRRAALEEQLGATAGDVEQLRADADRARTLAREIVDMYKPSSS